MDSTQLYKSAFERAKQAYGTGAYDDATLEFLFPELKESEDERIRKELLDAIDSGRVFDIEKETADRWLSWLEKQKKRQPLMCDGEVEDKKRDIVAAIRKYYPSDYAEYLTSFLKGLSPEDNSEDEYGQEMLGIAYKLMYEHIPKSLRTQEFWDALKFMREYTGRVAIIHSYQKSAEWTEEDEAMLNWLCRIIHSRKNHGELSLKEEGRLGGWIDKWINHSPQITTGVDSSHLLSVKVFMDILAHSDFNELCGYTKEEMTEMWEKLNKIV